MGSKTIPWFPVWFLATIQGDCCHFKNHFIVKNMQKHKYGWRFAVYLGLCMPVIFWYGHMIFCLQNRHSVQYGLCNFKQLIQCWLSITILNSVHTKRKHLSLTFYFKSWRLHELQLCHLQTLNLVEFKSSLELSVWHILAALVYGQTCYLVFMHIQLFL
jgi:hypothetical protein